mgnify:CR=1 FL=1
MLLEAAACNIPVIATPVGSIPTFVDNDNGYITDLDGFKAAMVEVMSNYEKAKNKSKKLYDKVNSTYQIDNIVGQYESIYESIIE